MKNKYNIVTIVPNSNGNIVERGTIDYLNTYTVKPALCDLTREQ